MLHINDVSKQFQVPPTLALDRISATLYPHQTVAIVGPSGCGKSTLLRIVSGLDHATSGQLEWQVDNPHVALMPQNDGLFQWRTVVDNVALPLFIHKLPPATARQAALDLLAQFELDEFAHAYPDQLSGGMRSRVAFLRTMLAEPTLIALDEPFGALDSMTRAGIQRWLVSAARQRALSILLVTHDVEEAITLADRVLVMSARPGRIVADYSIDLPNRTAPNLRTDPRFLHALTSIRVALEQGAERR